MQRHQLLKRHEKVSKGKMVPILGIFLKFEKLFLERYQKNNYDLLFF